MGVVGGIIVSEEGERAGNIFSLDGKIALVAEPGCALPPARRILDVAGCYVLPGLVDAHVHFREPGLAHKEGVANGSLAAAAGGVTMTIVMPTDDPMTADLDSFRQKIDIGRCSHVDYSLSAIVGPDAASVPALADAGCRLFEIFLSDVPDRFLVSDVAQLLDILEAIKAAGGIAGVTPMLQSVVSARTDRMIATGRREPLDFACSRPPVAESAGVAVACEAALATGCRVHLRQISTAQSTDLLRHYRSRAASLISAETLPQSLLLDEEHLSRFGPFAKMSPPLRPAGHAEALWGGLKDGVIDIVATDHAPHLRAEKEHGREDIWQAPSGIPGLETFLPVMLAEWQRGRISLRDIVRWTAASPAGLFGLAPRKGTIAPGSDADLVVLDPAARCTIRGRDMLTKAKYTPFEGRTVPGPLSYVLLRGTVIAERGRPVGAPSGIFLGPG